MNKLTVLHSEQDRSVNFIEEQLAGFLETRYVRKCEDYFVCYLSSHTGCNRGCTFCHLTATGQTAFEHTTLDSYLRQAGKVFDHYQQRVDIGAEQPARYMHYSFMARGEPLANIHLVHDGARLLTNLGQLARNHAGLPAKFCISTIMPRTLHRPLAEVFGWVSPTIYYSMYSIDEEWRARWMPGAMQVGIALRMLVEYQRFSKKLVKIHFSLIRGQNDSEEQVHQLCDYLQNHGLLCEFNLVRYNPFSSEQGEESPPEIIEERVEYIRSRFAGKVVVVPRVGYDVKASCGMFVS